MNGSPADAREIDSPYRPPQAAIEGAYDSAIGGGNENARAARRLT